MKKTLLIIIGLIALAAAAAFAFGPVNTERYFGAKPVSSLKKSSDIPEGERNFHQSLFVADLHADPLMWTRDLSKRSAIGHIDFPRMVEGGHDLQLFMAVADAPFNSTRESIERDFDQLALLAILDHWPVKTWFSRKERALYMAEKLHRMSRQSNGQFVVIRTQKDLQDFKARNATQPAVVAGLLGIEGGEPLEGRADNLAALFDAGYRVMGLAHYWDSDMSGSSSGARKTGLTAEGKKAVLAMEQLGMTIDVAHASEIATLDVLQIVKSPVFATHVGVRAVCNNSRNLSDDVIRKIALNGGVIGIGFFPEVTCANTMDALIRSIRHVRDLVGADHVALGSGFDAPVDIPVDVTGLPQITSALRHAGFTDDEIRKIMGDNVHRVLMKNLPPT